MASSSASCHSTGFAVILLSVAVLLSRAEDVTSGTLDGSEEWGYIDVREGAHMFWWLYRTPSQTKSPWPLLLWLEGGPGSSGTGYGNFGGIGPMTEELIPRDFTWLDKGHLLFVDSPVGTGYSYVDDSSLLLTTDEDVSVDLLTFLRKFFAKYEDLQKSPLFLVAESYGGKWATLLGVALDVAIKSRDVNATLGGVALGDSWISPLESVLTWGPVLKYFSRVDQHQEQQIISLTKIIEAQINDGYLYDAYLTWNRLVDLVHQLSNDVDIYNLLTDESQHTSSVLSVRRKRKKQFPHFLGYKREAMLTDGHTIGNLTYIMNGPIRDKLQIIPLNLIWVGTSMDVFDALTGVFMKDVVPKVDELLSTGINLTIYSGQLDLVCSTVGTENWVRKLNWTGLANFQSGDRVGLYCDGAGDTQGFLKAHENLAFYWILNAGHEVPSGNPCICHEMVGQIMKT